jgi:hypothetical protein
MFKLQQDNTTFQNLTFDGGGIFVERPAGGKNQNIVINNNTFRLNTTGDKGNGITFTNGLANSTISNNYFTNYTCVFAIYGYNYDGLTISGNQMVNLTAGIHIDAFGGSGNLMVQQNYLTGIKGMGMEFQGSATNLTFQDNWYEHPNLSSVYNQNLNSMAFSLILDKSRDITIRRNTVIAPERPDGTGCRVGFELGGDNTLCEDNYIDGVSITAYCTDNDGTYSVTLRNNKFMNFQYRDYAAFPGAGRTYTSYNNGPDVTLTWDHRSVVPRPGDADGDGDVDGVDIGIWAANFTGELGGTGTMTWSQGDWDMDGDVDGVDAGLWSKNFTGELGRSGAGMGSAPMVSSALPSAAVKGSAARAGRAIDRAIPEVSA